MSPGHRADGLLCETFWFQTSVALTFPVAALGLPNWRLLTLLGKVSNWQADSAIKNQPLGADLLVSGPTAQRLLLPPWHPRLMPEMVEVSNPRCKSDCVCQFSNQDIRKTILVWKKNNFTLFQGKNNKMLDRYCKLHIFTDKTYREREREKEDISNNTNIREKLPMHSAKKTLMFTSKIHGF